MFDAIPVLDVANGIVKFCKGVKVNFLALPVFQLACDQAIT